MPTPHQKHIGSNWFAFLVSKKHNYNFPTMLASMATVGGISAFMVWLHVEYDFLDVGLPSSLQTVLGFVVGLLLVFRTNTAYDRWWEGRKQLGTLINTCRNIAIKFETYLEDANEDKTRLAIRGLIPAFSWTMKEHLREHDYTKKEEWIPQSIMEGFDKAKHKPNFILIQIAKHTFGLNKRGVITGEQLIVLETEQHVLINALGACERIRNTPMPMGYAIHLKRILLIYVATLPLTFIDDLVWWTIPIVMLSFFTMVGIELLGEEIEEPFGEDPNDLPFDSINLKIRDNVFEIMEAEA